MNEHPSAQQLEGLLKGELDVARAAAVVEHLEGCDACLHLAERLWPAVGPLAGEEAIPLLAPEASSAIEDRLLGRIRDAAVGTELAWLATGGLLSVILVLLGSLLTFEGVPAAGRGTIE